VYNYENNHLAKKALETYHKINKDDEKSIVRWLLVNKYNNYYMLKVTDNWRKTGFLILETNPNLLVDCTGYFEGFFLKKIYSNQLNKIMKKYEPTAEYFEHNRGPVECSLEGYLKLHNKYLDLL
jgi:hypothetical protein